MYDKHLETNALKIAQRKSSFLENCDAKSYFFFKKPKVIVRYCLSISLYSIFDFFKREINAPFHFLLCQTSDKKTPCVLCEC